MGEKPGLKPPPSYQLVPAPIEDQYKQRLPVQQPTWWTLCTTWLQYHSTQMRWDIERQLARLLHRRWGS